MSLDREIQIRLDRLRKEEVLTEVEQDLDFIFGEDLDLNLLYELENERLTDELYS